jgi:hypothetical protein
MLMAGESDLGKLLHRMEPKLKEGKFYFATIDEAHLAQLSAFLGSVIDVFKEEEGLSIVFSEDARESISGLSSKDLIGPFALISLTVHSDLYAIGLLAKITAALASEGISVNAFSAYHHDHIFVPYERKDDAMNALAQI